MADTSPEFDLTRFSEGTRRQLYDRIAAIQFDGERDRHSPDDSGLQVVYFAGRWFATWTDLGEAPWRPEALRLRIARIGEGTNAGLELYDV
jgi:hypothetical protein